MIKLSLDRHDFLYALEGLRTDLICVSTFGGLWYMRRYRRCR